MEDRTILANELRTKLTMATEPNRALHVALHRHKQILRHNATPLQFLGSKAHHYFRATNHGYRVQGIEGNPVDECCDNAYVTAPLVVSAIHRYLDVEVEMSTPVFEI